MKNVGIGILVLSSFTSHFHREEAVERVCSSVASSDTGVMC